MRGKHENPWERLKKGGITPAGAGKTRACHSKSCSLKDHPRRCGENLDCIVGMDAHKGSPPQVRGKPSVSPHFVLVYRITPAGAGKTIYRSRRNRYNTDHPRRCGENSVFVTMLWITRGSPPQVRGKPSPYIHQIPLSRITPAGAGKTTVQFQIKEKL